MVASVKIQALTVADVHSVVTCLPRPWQPCCDQLADRCGLESLCCLNGGENHCALYFPSSVLQAYEGAQNPEIYKFILTPPSI